MVDNARQNESKRRKKRKKKTETMGEDKIQHQQIHRKIFVFHRFTRSLSLGWIRPYASQDYEMLGWEPSYIYLDFQI